MNTSEIAVVPSRWEEPFGRTSLEASSRGCATIISDRGGLKETTDSAVILKNLNSTELYNEIQKLIRNKKKRIYLHNIGKGAKFTRGRKWILVYKKCYKSKTKALKEEYLLKKNYKKRSKIKKTYINK